MAALAALTLALCAASATGAAQRVARSAPNSRAPAPPAERAATDRSQEAPAPIAIGSTADALRIPIENLDGAILFESTLRGDGERDTTGSLLLDTGAGYLALDSALLRALGIADSATAEMSFAPRPLPRIRAGGFEQDVVGPVLSIDTRVIRQATDRPVLGLLGQAPLNSFAVQLDYRSDTLALVPMKRDGLVASPPRRATDVDMAASGTANAVAIRASREQLGAALGDSAHGLPFELEGDGKILVDATLTDSDATADGEPVHLVLDTGATKTVLFEHAFRALPRRAPWPELRGLFAPTFYGSQGTYLARVPRIAMGRGGNPTAARDVDVAVMESELEQALSQAVRRPVDGLLGYSFLRRFRITIDYPHHVLWLEPVPVPRDQRPYEYSHVGVQVERREGELQVVAVAEGSPAAAAGIRPGDAFVSIEGRPVAGLDLIGLSRILEGRPGTELRFRLRRGGVEKVYRLKRRQLL